MSASSDYTLTPTLGLYKPVANAAVGLWGDLLNANADTLDSAIHASTGGGPYLPLAGNATVFGPTTFSGPVTFNDGSAGTINVLTHGAKGDGATDDTAAIQAALNAYAGEATILIPDTGHPFMTNILLVPNGTDLLIHGTVKSRPNSGTLLQIGNATAVTVRGHGTLDGDGTNQSSVQAVFYVFGSTNVKLSGLTIQNARNWNLNVVNSSIVHVDSVRLVGGANSNEFAQGCNNCWITNSCIDGVTGDGAFTFYSGITNSGITNCTIINGSFGAIGVFADAVGGSGSQHLPCSDILIANNICHDNKQGAISVSGPTIAHTNIIISGNRCYNNTVGNNIFFGEIFLSGGSRIAVNGNTLSGIGAGNAGGTGIWIAAAVSYVTITGNTIFNTGQGSTVGSGIFIQSAPNVLAEGNYIYDDQTVKTMQVGFGGVAGVNNTFIGNLCDGVAAGLGYGSGIALATDTIVAGDVQGTWTVGGPISAAVYSVIGAGPGFVAAHQFQINRVRRWIVGTDGVAEGGSNAGSNYTIIPYSDGNTALTAALTINRSTSQTTFGGPAPRFAALPVNAVSDAAAQSAGVGINGIYRNGSALQVRVA